MDDEGGDWNTISYASLLVDNISVIILYQVFVSHFTALSLGSIEYLSSLLFLKNITITLDAGIAQWGV